MAGSNRQTEDLLVAALAAGQTVVSAATSAKVSESTARRWLARPAFKARVIEARGKLLEETAARFVTSMGKAWGTLVALLEARSEQVRLGAARAIVVQGLQMRAAAEIEARLAAIEARAESAAEAAKLRGQYPTNTHGEGCNDA